MTTSTAGQWRRTVNGEDVYTEDGDWWWFHDHQGWFHVPGLVLEPPAPPLGVRVRDEVTRLTTGWPGLLGALRLDNGVFGRLDFVLCLALRGVLVYLWGWIVTLQWGWFDVLRSVQMLWYQMAMTVGLTDGAQPDVHGQTDYWYLLNDQQGKYAVGFIAFSILSLAILYVLYTTYVLYIDSHKGMALLAIPMAASVIARARRNEVSRMAEAIRQAQGP